MRFITNSTAMSGCLGLALLSCAGSVGGGNADSAVDQTVWFVDQANSSGKEDGTEEFPFTRIQDAINRAKVGDTVLLAEGRYEENVLLNRDLLLQGAGTTTTIVDGVGGEFAVFTPDTATSDSIIENMTLTGAIAEFGAAFLLGRPVIRNCIITGNGETADDDDDDDDDDDEISFKAGLHVSGATESTIEQCAIVDNSTTGVAYLSAGTLDLVGCLVACNTEYGIVTSGDRSSLDPDIRLTNCSVALNGLDGLYLDRSADAEVINTVFWANADNAIFESANAGDPILRFSDIVGGYFDADTDSIITDAAVLNSLDPPGTNVAVITKNPRFVDDQTPDLDFNLLETSSLVNAGDPDPVFLDTDGSRNDIGVTGGPTPGAHLTCTGALVTSTGFLVRDSLPLATVLPIAPPVGILSGSSPNGMRQVARVELTGDGRDDLILRDHQGQAWVFDGTRPQKLDVRIESDVWPIDIDNDGDTDLHIPGGLGRGNDALLKNDGRGRFVERSAARGLNLAEDGERIVLGWDDVDLDGDADLIVQESDGSRRAYLSLGVNESFVEVIPDGVSVNAVRVDLDGDFDFLPWPRGKLQMLAGHGRETQRIGVGRSSKVDLEIFLEGGSRVRVYGVARGQGVVVSSQSVRVVPQGAR